MQMSSLPLAYVGYADGVSHQTQHIASAAWFIYTPESELFCSGVVFLVLPTTILLSTCPSFTSHGSVIKGHLQSGGQVRLLASRYAIDKPLSRP